MKVKGEKRKLEDKNKSGKTAANKKRKEKQRTQK